MNMKKLVSLVLALVMVMAMMVPAMAEEAETYTIKNNGTHTYEVYQIFTGDLSEGVLSNVKWGKNGTGIKGEAVDASILSELESTSGTDAQKLAVITKYADLTATNKFNTVDAGATISVPAGYYLIKDTDGAVTGNDVYTTYIVVVVEDVEINTKSDVPEVEKKVKDTNDSDGTTSGWQDSADYDIGDTIAFKLTATLPENYSDYKVYELVFTDTMENMEQATITSVYLADKAGNKVADFADADYNKANTANGFTVTFENLKASSIKDQILDEYKIVIEYTAVLSQTASTGIDGNDNKVKITYTNNPNWDGTGDDEPTGETPEDMVVVFTFKLIVNKVDQNNAALTGAGFTLYKYDVNAEGDDKWVAVGEEMTGDQMTQFVWTGLDDGKYKLVETTTPTGYNTIADIEFTVSATHDEKSDNPQLTALTTTFDQATTDVTNGSVTGTVQNQKGATLPETGGMGTTMIYIAGGLLVAFAAVMLITKRRMNAAE